MNRIKHRSPHILYYIYILYYSDIIRLSYEILFKNMNEQVSCVIISL